MAPSKRKAHYTHTKETGIKSWGSSGFPTKKMGVKRNWAEPGGEDWGDLRGKKCHLEVMRTLWEHNN